MTLEERYQAAIMKISALGLLDLPKDVKTVLKKTTDLETKTKMLEMIAEQIN